MSRTRERGGYDEGGYDEGERGYDEGEREGMTRERGRTRERERV